MCAYRDAIALRLLGTRAHMTWGRGGRLPRGWAGSPGGRCGRGPWGGPAGTGGQLESRGGICHLGLHSQPRTHDWWMAEL